MTVKQMRAIVVQSIEEGRIFCLGCQRHESVVIPPRSGVVGLAAVHSSGLICIPKTISALIAEKYKKHG